MKNKPLSETNPYLKDPIQRERLVAHSVRTSCGVEGIKDKGKTPDFPITNRKEKNIYKAKQ